MTLMNLCYLVKCDPDSKFTEEEFMIISRGILGGSGDIDIFELDSIMENDMNLHKTQQNSKKQKKNIESELIKKKFISSIYAWVSYSKQIKKNETTIQQFFNLFLEMARLNSANFDYDFGLVSRFKNFLLDITNKNKKAYLVKFDVRSCDPD